MMLRAGLIIAAIFALGCEKRAASAPPEAPTEPEPAQPPLEPGHPVPGLYALDLAAALDAAEQSSGKPEQVAEVRRELEGGRAWLLVGEGEDGVVLLQVRSGIEHWAVKLSRGPADVSVSVADPRTRAPTLCRVHSANELSCDLIPEDGVPPVPLTLERARQRPGLPAPGLYAWQEPTTRSAKDEARQQEMRTNLERGGLSAARATTLAEALWKRPSMHAIAGEEALILGYGIASPVDRPSMARLSREASWARLIPTEAGFRIEQRVRGLEQPLVYRCSPTERGYRCVDPGGVAYDYAHMPEPGPRAAWTEPEPEPEPEPESEPESELLGIPECDEYIAKYSRCIEEAMPESAREVTQRALKVSMEAWREHARSAQGREEVAAACATAMEAAKSAMTSMGCSFD